MIKVGIIGGSGLEDPGILSDPKEDPSPNQFGLPSSSILSGTIEGVDVVILSRHGRQHTIPPSQVNNRANIFALKQSGCTHILSTTACGSLREDISRGDLIIPDQFIDFTRHRDITFHDSFDPGDMKHTPMADPFNEQIREILINEGRKLGLKVRSSGTIITIEGPRFSTRAESKMFRSWGADLVNMSIAPEVILACEAGIPYATIAMSTDYDSWKDDADPVSWEEIIRIFNLNVGNVSSLLIASIKALSDSF
jgi:5'-methylthioadenosine phosphorylase